MLKISKNRLKIILGAMKSKTILVIGDLMLDEYIWGKVERLSPEAPVPIVEVQKEDFKLGGAGNVANNLLALGSAVRIGSVIGNDKHGEILGSLLKNMEILTDQIFTDPLRRTIVKTRIIAHTQQVARIDKEDRFLISDELRTQIINSTKDVLDSIDAIILSDYAKGIVDKTLIDELVILSRKKGILISVDPKEKNFPFYKQVSLITPNTKELSFAAGIKIEDENDIIKAALKVKSMLGCDMILVTRGEHGMSLFENNGTMTHIPTNAKAVFDVTGAGDTVISCFTLAVVSGATPKEAAIISNVAAGIVVGEVGAASVPWDKLYDVCMEEICG